MGPTRIAPEKKTGLKGKRIETVVVKAPRPLPPWKVHQEKKRKHGKGHFIHRIMSKLHVMADPAASEESEAEEECKEPKIETRKRKYCQRTACPFAIFALGFGFLIFFTANLIYVVNRDRSACAVVGFKKGKNCRDCAFEIKVDGLAQSGFLTVKFNEEGESEMEAFRDCGSGASCCKFRTSFEEATNEATFCDIAPWDCHYMRGVTGGPYDIAEGNLMWNWMLCYFGIALVLFLWPVTIAYNRVQDQKVNQTVETALEQSKLQFEAAERAEHIRRGVWEQEGMPAENEDRGFPN